SRNGPDRTSEIEKDDACKPEAIETQFFLKDFRKVQIPCRGAIRDVFLLVARHGSVSVANFFAIVKTDLNIRR
ncbi:MAG: hypothetical protein ABL907_10330, partial [Hyphomicrobium sp.]